MPASITAKPIGKDASALVRALKVKSSGAKDAALNLIGREMKADFEEITDNWRHKPRFVIRRTPETVSVTTDHKIFAYVDKGTRPHVIKAKGKRPLKYRKGYKAKTRPNNPSFTGPGRAAGAWRSAKQVRHPGSRARNFTRIIANVWKKEGARLLRAELRRVK